jgi:hypothetical protein
VQLCLYVSSLLDSGKEEDEYFSHRLPAEPCCRSYVVVTAIGPDCKGTHHGSCMCARNNTIGRGGGYCCCCCLFLVDRRDGRNKAKCRMGRQTSNYIYGSRSLFVQNLQYVWGRVRILRMKNYAYIDRQFGFQIFDREPQRKKAKTICTDGHPIVFIVVTICVCLC